MPTHTPEHKLDLLEAFIADPRTPEHEREAAQAMLTRLLAEYRAELKANHVDTTWYGAKYDDVPRRCATTVITTAIREEIKTIRKVGKKVAGAAGMPLRDPIGGAPAEVKVSVTTPHHAAITIRVTGVPDEWGWVREDRYGTGEVALWPSAALRALLDALRDLANAYNHDNSDITTDYFDSRFIVNVAARDGDSPAGRIVA